MSNILVLQRALVTICFVNVTVRNVVGVSYLLQLNKYAGINLLIKNMKNSHQYKIILRVSCAKLLASKMIFTMNAKTLYLILCLEYIFIYIAVLSISQP